MLFFLLYFMLILILKYKLCIVYVTLIIMMWFNGYGLWLKELVPWGFKWAQECVLLAGDWYQLLIYPDYSLLLYSMLIISWVIVILLKYIKVMFKIFLENFFLYKDCISHFSIYFTIWTYNIKESCDSFHS